MKQADFSYRLVEILGDLQQFVIRDPDNSRRTCTAVPALSTRELQPIFEPWGWFFAGLCVACFRHCCSSNLIHDTNLFAQCNRQASA